MPPFSLTKDPEPTSMRILHTSDWHLGQSFFTKSRQREHAAFINWMLALVDEQHIDAIVIAGDIFDTGTPPSYARELYLQFVGALQSKRCSLVVLGGNHDSVSVLNESKSLLHYLNCHVVPSTYGDIEDQVIKLNNRKGEVGAILCAVPFIRARDVLKSQPGVSAIDKRKSLADAIKQHYATLYSEALRQRKALNADVPIIATGHLTALGVSQSESVRDIYIGTLEGFAADGFPPADYIALGHIHRPQKVAGKESIRYSGSPIPLSFDELNTQKQVLIAQFREGKLDSVTPIAIPRFQPMEVIRGNLNEIEQALNSSELLQQASEACPVWLCIEVETQDYLTDLQQRIQTFIEGKHGEILQLKRRRQRVENTLSVDDKVSLSELSVKDVFNARLEIENFDDEEDKERKARIEQQFDEVLEHLDLALNGEDMKEENE
jgi:exonuclease SbcD